MYICNYCDYSTNDKGNYSHHKKSKKHLSKLDQIKIQEYETVKKENDELKQKLADKEIQQKLLEKEISPKAHSEAEQHEAIIEKLMSNLVPNLVEQHA